MSITWAWLMVGFLAGMFFTFMLVLGFWANETRRYRRNHRWTDEHASHYTQRRG
jgi:hypothetical protein